MKTRKMLMNFILSSLIALTHFTHSVMGCGYPGAPAHSSLTFSGERLEGGVVATYACERGFELLGPARRVCQEDGKWAPEGIPFCVLNVAAGKAPMQSSVANDGIPQRAVDGSPANFFNPKTCTLTQPERAPWWYVNLLEPYMVQLVRLDFGRPCCGDGGVANIVVRVGNNRPDLGVNPVCNKFVGVIEEGKPLFLPCNPPIPGAFVSVQLEGPPGNALSICEAFVYTDQALPIERCPQFRDQPPGSTATYNSKCYIFYNQQSLRFDEARQFCSSRGGSLVDDSNPALQGFLSWEMWRRHRSEPSAQYWLGATRESPASPNWKWLNGKDVSVSFWNLPSGRGRCARFDGAKGWLWSDSDCNDSHYFICTHGPKGCGRPEQPPNSTLLATSLEVGAKIEHICDSGHLLVGPHTRTCLPNGFYSEFPPLCRYLECGLPAQIPHGSYTFLNNSRGYESVVRYSCAPNTLMVGRPDLICDTDAKWNGPPPRCEPLSCPQPPSIAHGYFSILEEGEGGWRVGYECDEGWELEGEGVVGCSEGAYDNTPPSCVEKVPLTPVRVPVTTVVSKPPPTLPPSTTPHKYEDYEEEEEEKEIDENNNNAPHTPEGNVVNGHHGHEHSHAPFSPVSKITPPTNPPPPRTTSSSSVSSSVVTSSNKVTSSVTSSVTSKDKPRVNSPKPIQPIGDVIGNNLETEGAESINVNSIHRGKGAGADEPGNKVLIQTKASAISRLNLGGIIALGVFGGIIFLAAIITSVVLLIRRKRVKGKHARHRSSPDNQTITSVDSGSDVGLGRLYRRAWDSLAATGTPPIVPSHSKSTHKMSKDTLDFRSRLSSVEGLRDDGEIIVHDALPRKHHHHHHHGLHHHHNNGEDWGKSTRSNRSRY